MRKITFGGAVSLDNFLARTNHAVDWLLWGEEVETMIAEYWQKFDTVLMGRKTYEQAAKMGQASGYPGMKNVVFSRTLQQVPEPVILVSDDAVEFTRKLKQQEGKGICLMGGGDLGRSFLEADLIDEIGFNFHPLLLGTGIPLFYPMSRQINLELTDLRKFKNGCVSLTYNVKHDDVE